MGPKRKHTGKHGPSPSTSPARDRQKKEVQKISQLVDPLGSPAPDPQRGQSDLSWNKLDPDALHADPTKSPKVAESKWEELFNAELGSMFNPKAVGIIARAYAYRDATGDGCLNRDELCHFMEDVYQATGTPAPTDEMLRQQVVAVFRKYDTDRNRRLDPKEICGYLRESHFQRTSSVKWMSMYQGSPRAARKPGDPDPLADLPRVTSPTGPPAAGTGFSPAPPPAEKAAPAAAAAAGARSPAERGQGRGPVEAKKERQRQLRDLFDEIDGNADEVLDIDEVRSYLDDTGCTPRPEDLERLFLMEDTITFDDFIGKKVYTDLTKLRQAGAQAAYDQHCELVESGQTRVGIPDRTLRQILGYIGDIPTLRAAASCCSRWRTAALSDQLWRRVLVQRRRMEQAGAKKKIGMLPDVKPEKGQLHYDWYINWVRVAFADVRAQGLRARMATEMCNGGECVAVRLDHAGTSVMPLHLRSDGGQVTTDIVQGDEKGFVHIRPLRDMLQQTGGERELQSEHDSGVGCLAQSESYLWCGSDDCTVTVWETQTETGLKRPSFLLLGHKETVTVLNVAEWDEKVCVTGGMDRLVIIWDNVERKVKRGRSAGAKRGSQEQLAQQIQPRAVCEGHGMKVTSIVLTKEYIYSSARDCKVLVWDWKGKPQSRVTMEHPGPVNGLALLPACGSEHPYPVLASVCGGGMVKAWQASTAKALAGRRVHEGPIECVRAVPSLGVTVTGSWDNNVCIYNPATNLVAAQLKGHDGAVRALWVDDARRRVVSGSDDRTVAVWDFAGVDLSLEKTQVGLLYQLQGPKQAVVAMCIVLRDDTPPPPPDEDGAEPPPPPVIPPVTAPWACAVVATREKTLFAWEFARDAAFQGAGPQ